MATDENSAQVEALDQLEELDDLESRLQALEQAEDAIDRAYSTGKAERAKITQAAQLDAAEAVAMVGIAMEADEEADEAMRISVIAEHSGDRERAKAARKREREARKRANAEHKAATKSAKQAYDAIKFSAPNKMGFMRFVQVLYALHIAFLLIFLMLTSRDHMQYTVSSMFDWVMVILEAVAFWMFVNRYKIARPFVMGMTAFNIVATVVYDIVTGQFSFVTTAINISFLVFLFFYFAFSPRVKVVLVNDFAQHKGDYEKDTFVIERKGWPFVRNLIMYFIIFSILGHWMEMGMCQFIIMGLVEGEYDPTNTMLWRDWLYPFPMEGAAVVLIALFLYPLFTWMKKKFTSRLTPYIISFVANGLTCALIEFSMGLIVNADLQLWDYSEQFGNIMGQVCLQNTIAFGAAASIITWCVYPMLERWIAQVPRDYMNIIFVVVVVFGAIVWSLYIVNPPGVDEQNKHPELAEEIAEQEAAQQEATERSKLDASAAIVEALNQRLRENVEQSEVLSDAEKQALLEQIDAIDASVAQIRDEIDAEEALAAASELESEIDSAVAAAAAA